MKILVLCQYFYPEQFLINDIVPELVKKGHDVTVLTGRPNYPDGKIKKGYKKIRNTCVKMEEKSPKISDQQC